MTLIPAQFHKDLQTQFYAKVNFPLTKAEIDEAMEAFFAFLKLPDDVKNHINLDIAPKHRRGDVGFKARQSGDHIYNDDKAFFHFHPAVFDHYADFINANATVKNFMEKAAPIWDMAARITQEALQTFENDHQDIRQKVFGTKYPHILLRFLEYRWQNSGKYLAKPHFDAGSFTLAIAESGPGLRVGSGPENLEAIKHEDQKALFMLSSNVNKVMEDERFKPGWHDVVQMDETHIGKPYARWALVAFIEAADVEALPRTETHKFYTPDTKSA